MQQNSSEIFYLVSLRDRLNFKPKIIIKPKTKKRYLMLKDKKLNARTAKSGPKI